MRVVVTGISGLDKEALFRNIKALCNDKDLNNSYVDKDVCFDDNTFNESHIDSTYDLEHEMCKLENFKVPNYLDISEDELIKAKNRTLDYIIKQSGGNDHILLAMHSTYYRRSSLYSVIDWSKLREFKPDLFITLLDNIHSIKQRIQSNPNAGSVKYISMRDLLWWREIEILTTQQIANNLCKERIPHYLIAREQMPTLLYQLMFESKKRKVYASYPITAAIRDPAFSEEISDFIQTLKKHFIVFDPLAIGEKELQYALIENLRSPYPEPKIRIVKMNGDDIDCDIEDILAIISAINGQIVSRDERLILQSDMVIGYRPTHSPGAQHELRFAKNISRIETYIVHTPSDSTSPFVQELADAAFPSTELLIKALKK